MLAALSHPTIAVASGVIHELELETAHIAGRAALRLHAVGDEQEIREATKGASALVVNAHPMPRRHLEALDPGVGVLARAGTGLDSIDLEAARELGLVVYHTPDYCVEEVATHALAWILALARRLVPGDLVARTNWVDWRSVGEIRPLSELRVGIVGAGRIGSLTARLVRPMVASVTVFDPYVAPKGPGIRRARSLAGLLRESDILSLHSPLTSETRALIGERELALLPPGAMVVNCSRGGLIDEAALLASLERGHISGAALDVLETEPPRPDHPLLASDRVSLSPHIGWYSTGSERRVRIQAIDGVLSILDGRPPASGRVAVEQERLRGPR